MRIRFIQAILDKIRIELDSLHPAPFKVFYIGGKNAGDIFNAPLLKYFNIRYCKTRLSNSNLLCVGSILGSFVYPKNTKKPRGNLEKNYSKEEIREFKVMYNHLARVESHNVNKAYMYQRLAEYIWRRDKNYDELYSQLTKLIN